MGQTKRTGRPSRKVFGGNPRLYQRASLSTILRPPLACHITRLCPCACAVRLFMLNSAAMNPAPLNQQATGQGEKIQAAIRQVLARHASITIAILFGSLAANGPRKDSDLDVAIGSTIPLALETRIQLIEELAVALGRPVDLIDLSAAHSPLLHQILTQGQLLFCKDRSQYAELLRRLVYEEADVMPYYRRILAERRHAWIGA